MTKLERSRTRGMTNRTTGSAWRLVTGATPEQFIARAEKLRDRVDRSRPER